MPSSIPRVATYIQPHLKDKFEEFRKQRGIKSESQALATILSEFLGVTQNLARSVDYSSFVTQEQFSELVSRVSELEAAIEKGNSPRSLISKLPDKLVRLENRVTSLELDRSEVQSLPQLDKPVQGQGTLLDLERFSEQQGESPITETEPPNPETDLPKSELPGVLPSSSVNRIEPMKGEALSKRLEIGYQYLMNMKSKWKNEPEKFIAWIKEKDPDKIPWQYNREDRLYHPIINSSPVSFSSSPI